MSHLYTSNMGELFLPGLFWFLSVINRSGVNMDLCLFKIHAKEAYILIFKILNATGQWQEFHPWTCEGKSWINGYTWGESNPANVLWDRTCHHPHETASCGAKLAQWGASMSLVGVEPRWGRYHHFALSTQASPISGAIQFWKSKYMLMSLVRHRGLDATVNQFWCSFTVFFYKPQWRSLGSKYVVLQAIAWN